MQVGEHYLRLYSLRHENSCLVGCLVVLPVSNFRMHIRLKSKNVNTHFFSTVFLILSYAEDMLTELASVKLVSNYIRFNLLLSI